MVVGFPLRVLSLCVIVSIWVLEVLSMNSLTVTDKSFKVLQYSKDRAQLLKVCSKKNEIPKWELESIEHKSKNSWYSRACRVCEEFLGETPSENHIDTSRKEMPYDVLYVLLHEMELVSHVDSVHTIFSLASTCKDCLKLFQDNWKMVGFTKWGPAFYTNPILNLEDVSPLTTLKTFEALFDVSPQNGCNILWMYHVIQHQKDIMNFLNDNWKSILGAHSRELAIAVDRLSIRGINAISTSTIMIKCLTLGLDYSSDVYGEITGSDEKLLLLSLVQSNPGHELYWYFKIPIELLNIAPYERQLVALERIFNSEINYRGGTLLSILFRFPDDGTITIMLGFHLDHSSFQFNIRNELISYLEK